MHEAFLVKKFAISAYIGAVNKVYVSRPFNIATSLFIILTLSSTLLFIIFPSPEISNLFLFSIFKP